MVQLPNRKDKFLMPACLLMATLFSHSNVTAQQLIPQLTHVDEAEASVDLDGFLDESVWSRIPAIDGMQVISPDTLAPASLETHTKIFYTDEGIYVGIMNFQDPATLVARMTSRDTRLERDGVVINVDPSGQGLYGYMMRINLGDSMTDATLLPERQMNMQWDGSWSGRTQALDNGWSAELFIPWSMMSLPQTPGEVRQMGFYIERQVGHLVETWSNPPLPNTVNEFLSAFQKVELRNIESRQQLTYYPFVSSTFDNIKNEIDYRVGTDIYWRPSTNMQLSAALNPDFGNVESDDVVVNLTAFETFFPEKRPFFLEGQDIFNTSPRSGGGGPGGGGPGGGGPGGGGPGGGGSGGGGPPGGGSARSGFGPTTLLNTRRIGRAPAFTVPGTVSALPTDLSTPSDLLGAVKLTGQNGAWRYGTLMAAEDDTAIRARFNNGSRTQLEAEGRDYLVGRLLYEDTLGGGRRAIGWMGTNMSHDLKDATVNGIDMHYFAANTRWVFDGQLVHSDVNGVTGAGGWADLSYQPQRGRQHRITATYLDDTLDINDMGFIIRNDMQELNYSYNINESNIPGLRSRFSSYMVTNQWNTAGQPVRLGFFANRGYTFMDNSNLFLGLRYFNPRIEDRLGRGTGDFRIPERWSANAGWSSNPSAKLSYGFNYNGGQGDLGKRELGFSGNFSYRPIDNFSLGMDLSYSDQEALLVYRGAGTYTSFEAEQWSPRVDMDYFITAKQQLRFSMQWTGLKAFEDKFWRVVPNEREFLNEMFKPTLTSHNFSISRMTFQARYRWEIAPLSDLFIVYTRGSNLPANTFDEYPELAIQAWTDRIVDTLVVKIRYRFGS